MNKSTKIALGIGSGAIAGFAVAMLIKRHSKNKKTAVLSGIASGGIVSAGAVALVLAEEKRRQKRLEYAEKKMLPQNEMWFHIGQTNSFIRAESSSKNSVKYYYADGSGIERSGGSRSLRNNNPGNIRQASYSIGTAGGFAVFADYETGFYAILDLLQSENYINLSIEDAVMRYAPPVENDTENYKKLIASFTGLDNSRILNSLSQNELNAVAMAIQRIEGYFPGTETRFAVS